MGNYQLRMQYFPFIIRTHAVHAVRDFRTQFVTLNFDKCWKWNRPIHLVSFIAVDKIEFFPHFARDAPFNSDIFETLRTLIAQKTVCFIKSWSSANISVFTLLDYSLDFIIFQVFAFPETHQFRLLDVRFAQSFFLLNSFLTFGLSRLKPAGYHKYHISQTTESK